MMLHLTHCCVTIIEKQQQFAIICGKMFIVIINIKNMFKKEMNCQFKENVIHSTTEENLHIYSRSNKSNQPKLVFCERSNFPISKKCPFLRSNSSDAFSLSSARAFKITSIPKVVFQFRIKTIPIGFTELHNACDIACNIYNHIIESFSTLILQIHLKWTLKC